MNKLLQLYDKYILKILVSFLILFIALYPKLPSVHIIRTWVYIRLEDFAIFGTALLWFVQLLRRKVTLPVAFGIPIAAYWIIGFISVVFSIVFIGPHLTNYFPHIALLEFGRRIEYMILFFIAFSTIKSQKDIRDYFIVLSVTVFAAFVYGFGQKYYLDAWAAFPKFFEKLPFCFPSFQTGNEEFAKGIPLCLPKDARITSTFGGHYDLAAYLVVVLPVFIGVFVSVKKWSWRILSFILFLAGLMLLLFTSSRTSFLAYLIGAVFSLWIFRKKLYIIPVAVISIAFLFIFSQSTAKRLLETFRVQQVVTTQTGQVVGEVLPPDLKNKVTDKILPPANNGELPTGSDIIALPGTTKPTATNSALVSKQLSIEEIKRLGLANGSIELSTISGTFLVKKALVYDISFTTRFQAEWPNAWKAFLRNPLLGSGFSSITLATDNDYFRALGETGLLGLLAFIGIFLIFGIGFSELAANNESQMSKGLLYGLTGGVIGLTLNATLIDVFESSKVAETLWLLLGICAGSLLLHKHTTVNYALRLKQVLTSGTAIVMYFIFLIAAYFISSANNFFVADDFTWLRWSASATLSDVAKFFTDSHNFFYRPFDKLIVFILYTVSAFRPQSYHVFTLLLHFLAVYAVYRLAYKLLKNKLLAFITAFIFLALPIHGENIYWFSTISVTLGAVFLLYTCLAFIRYREKGSVLAYIITLILSICAFLSYEIAVIVPFLLVCIDVFVTKVKKRTELYMSYLPFVLMIPVYYLVRFVTHAFSGGGDYSYSMPHLIPNVAGNIFGYIGIFLAGEPFIPVYNALRITMRLHIASCIVLVLFIIIISVLLLNVFKNQLRLLWTSDNGRFALFGLAFGLTSLLPFLALGNIAERYLYLASAGFALTIVIILNLLVRRFLPKSGLRYELILVIVAVLLGLWYQAQNFKENQNWQTAGEVTKNMLSLMRISYETIPPASSFYFVNTPVTMHNVWVFPVGLEDALWFIYRDQIPVVHRVKSINEAKAAIQQSISSSNYIFYFDSNGQISRVE